ncbi:MAG: polysaccharide biosynthesis protein [Gammaproteobacteria bacterium]|nr:MAG: polysaccharide biosynthesis protein [Gammaproteobacteria bacterium]
MQNTSSTSLKRLALKGSVWIMFGVGTGQALRFVGNMILTRLLSPQAFGIMGIVNALLMGLGMFSDVGLRPSIIQNKRGEEPTFLRTAWTIQVIRGIVLTLLAAALAWPIAWQYNEPSLVLIIMVASLTSLIAGFHSTWLLVYSRRMTLAPLTILELTSYLFNLIAMILCAWYFHSVWALVLGAFVGSIVKLIASHTILSGVQMRFQWEPSAVTELIRFGQWIFINTAMGFLVARLDVFIFGSFAGMGMLGLYILAKNLSDLVMQVLKSLTSNILFPVYSRLAKQNIKILRHKMFKARIILLAVFLPPLWTLILWGDNLVALLYDDRYIEAGWMLQILAAGATATTIRITIGPIFLAMGDSFRRMLNTAIRLCLQIVSMSVGAYFWGMPGFFIGLALTDLLSYPALIYLTRSYGVWLPLLDTLAFGTSIFVIGVAFWLS